MNRRLFGLCAVAALVALGGCNAAPKAPDPTASQGPPEWSDTKANPWSLNAPAGGASSNGGGAQGGAVNAGAASSAKPAAPNNGNPAVGPAPAQTGPGGLPLSN